MQYAKIRKERKKGSRTEKENKLKMLSIDEGKGMKMRKTRLTARRTRQNMFKAILDFTTTEAE